MKKSFFKGTGAGSRVDIILISSGAGTSNRHANPVRFGVQGNSFPVGEGWNDTMLSGGGTAR